MTTDQELLRDLCPKVEWNEFLFLFKFFFVSTNCRVPALERLVRPETQSFLESSWRIYSSIQRFRGVVRKVVIQRFRRCFSGVRSSTSPTTAAVEAAHVTSDVATTCQPSSMVTRPRRGGGRPTMGNILKYIKIPSSSSSSSSSSASSASCCQYD